ncbi:hypothetical protein HD554DRAFT_742892 [Boletus coccyginus]|nr:hypothetical protein HD554DRAFT_742892 [Boletus coccyginus]
MKKVRGPLSTCSVVWQVLILTIEQTLCCLLHCNALVNGRGTFLPSQLGGAGASFRGCVVQHTPPTEEYCRLPCVPSLGRCSSGANLSGRALAGRPHYFQNQLRAPSRSMTASFRSGDGPSLYTVKIATPSFHSSWLTFWHGFVADTGGRPVAPIDGTMATPVRFEPRFRVLLNILEHSSFPERQTH